MRTRTGKLLADLNDSIGAEASASVPNQRFAGIDENQTTYNLFPYELNDPPVILKGIFEASEPQMQSDLSYKPSDGNVIYYSEENTVKVMVGTSFALRIQAQQPNVLNVENGVPEIKPLNRELRYEWLKDGDLVFEVEPSFLEDRPDRISANVSELVFTNVSARMAGRYSCIIINDIGETESEVIDLEIYDPTLPDDPYFKVNLIQNGFATDGTSNWTTLVGDVTSKPLLSKASEFNAKVPNSALFGHTAMGMYPYPTNIRFNGIRNYNIASIATGKKASYFTRDNLQYLANGGTEVAVMYQDVDLSEITDFISGKVYGCTGVRAYFGCIIGNAISRYIPTFDMLLPENKYDRQFYFMGAPRISYENFILTGPGLIEESVTVTIQEYNGSAPLPSLVYENNQTKYVNSIQIRDTLSSIYSAITNEQVDPPAIGNVTTVEGASITPIPITGRNGRVINTYKQLYANKEDYFAFGQYADYRDSIIRFLNPKTNRIKVTIAFELDTARNLQIMPGVTSNGLLDVEPFTKPYYKLIPKEFTKDAITIVRQSQNEQYQTKPFSELFPQSVPKTMATGLGLILEPITARSVKIESFRDEIGKIPTKAAEVRPPSVNAYTDANTFAQAAANTTGITSAFDLQGEVPIYFWRKYNDAKATSVLFDQEEYGRDGETCDGSIVISNLATGEVYYSTEETHAGDTNINFPGLSTIRIQVRSHGKDDRPDDGNWREGVYPWLSIQTVNETSLIDVDGRTRVVHLWPSLVSGVTSPIAFFQHNAPVPSGFYNTSVVDAVAAAAGIAAGVYTASPAVGYITSAAVSELFAGQPTLNFVGASLPQPLGIGGNSQGQDRLARTIIVDVPSNQISQIYAGLRHNNNGNNTNGGTIYTKIGFQSNILSYYKI